MPNSEHSVTILGGGIRGAAVAALLAQTQLCQVRLLERGRVAAGATSTNHGRLHSGTSLWRHPDVVDIIQRRRAGCELIRTIPGVIGAEQTSLHLIEDAEDRQRFEQVCTNLSIPCLPISLSALPSAWISQGQFAGAYEVPEFSFNPARLAARLASHAQRLQADVNTGAAVRSLTRGQQRLYCVQVADGRSYETDVVVNALGAWVSNLESDLALPQLALKWPQQRLLCLRTAELSRPVPLDRVMTVIDRADRIPSALPHGPWIVFGCDLKDSELLQLPFPDAQFDVPWRKFERLTDKFKREKTIDAVVLEGCAQYFLPLRQLASQDYAEHLFSFSGTYPHLASDPDRHFRIHQSPEVPGYYALSGGNATTAVIDALDMVEVVLSHLDLPDHWTPERTRQLQEQFTAGLTATEFSSSAGMVWQDH